LKAIIVLLDMSQMMFRIKPFSLTNECSRGSGGGTNGINLTLPLEQYNSGASFLNLNALQY